MAYFFTTKKCFFEGHFYAAGDRVHVLDLPPKASKAEKDKWDAKIPEYFQAEPLEEEPAEEVREPQTLKELSDRERGRTTGRRASDTDPAS